jgi:hypothetical protein
MFAMGKTDGFDVNLIKLIVVSRIEKRAKNDGNFFPPLMHVHLKMLSKKKICFLSFAFIYIILKLKLISVIKWYQETMSLSTDAIAQNIRFVACL